jgi:N-acetylneuraminic acid mutarotase
MLKKTIMKSALKLSTIILLWVGTLSITQSCKKETLSPPVLLTVVASSVTQSSAISGGVISDDGGAEVTARGVCWSTSQNPTTSSSKTADGRGTGYFSSVVAGLAANTTYYIRAYAINSEGTNYGDQLDFTTSFQSSGIQKSNFPGGERSGAVSFAIGTKVYLGLGWLGFNSGNIGVRDFWEWDQATNIWTKKADYPGNSVSGAVGFSIGAKGYIGTGSGLTGNVTNEFWEYDPATNTWTEKASLPVSAARALASGFSIGTKGYIGAGMFNSDWDYYSYLRDLWEWDQTTNIWTRKADIGGFGRYAAVGFSIGTKGYIGTGDTENGTRSKDFWEWDQATNIWTRKADMEGLGRSLAVGFSIGTKGYIGTGDVFDGINGLSARDIWEWDQVTNIWTRKADLEGDGRNSAIGFSIGDKGYIGTGFNLVLENSLQDFWEYDPK